jgi:membrane protein implicated in regulation of membrane protease activity
VNGYRSKQKQAKIEARQMMWIVAIAWMYVVVLMAATETSVIGGVMTLLFVGVLPLSLLSYFFGAKGRRARHKERVEKMVRQGKHRPREGGEQ